MDNFEDIEIKCKCGRSFVWTAGEQKFMSKLLQEGKLQRIFTPRHCPKCRRHKKETQEKDENLSLKKTLSLL